MKRFSLLILAPAVLCLNAFAANQGQQQIPFNGSITNPCNGETVDFSGTVHGNSTITVNGNNFHATFQFNPQGVNGNGETTGAKYQATGVTREDFNGSFTNGSFNETFINRFDFMGQGSTPNFSVHETFHITVNANGTVSVSFDNFSTTCH